MILDYCLTITAIAGTAVLWRNWLVDHSSWRDWIETHFYAQGKFLTCGSCFTYWLAGLWLVIFYNPLGSWQPNWNWPSLLIVYQSFHFFISWMAISFGAVALRFGYVALQELVSWQVHRHENLHKH